ncbi:isochorismatase family cysteine hydrolase [Cohnella thailandensis]|uniref:Cysteine hydrolase n=1 Tax=Cohnella thailandensis TaxID=557557 RepID=A0A841SY09_9BACL|nr:isochorismatase family cysteine hydrolase [Cohnella thailandensis]MBB6636794.1 cysteine hydrolase [Cohnella thailandensis]MBP1973329.1 nicotinamidase-related amidase [Cohnella thailandensis]
MKIAFLIIDVQNIFINELRSHRNVARPFEYINHVSNMMRQNGQLVVHVRDVEEADDGKGGLDIVPEIVVSSEDRHVEKLSSNSFWQTDLERMLKEYGPDLVVLSGYAAQYCVLATYNGAIERGFKAVMLQNGLLSEYEDAIQDVYRDRHVVSYPVLSAILASRK